VDSPNGGKDEFTTLFAALLLEEGGKGPAAIARWSGPLCSGQLEAFQRRILMSIRFKTAPAPALVQTNSKPRLIKASSTPLMLSIVMPAYNEGRTIAHAIQRVLNVPFPCPIELIVVNDGSRDDTADVLETIADPRVVVESHPTNRGKGAAILTGLSLVRGTHVVPFDADLEYEPRDLVALLEPVILGRSDVVYGSRLFGANTVFQSYRYAMGNKLTTLMANLLFDSYISDLHTCLKLMPTRLLRDLALREKGFGLDTEITAHVLKLGYRPFEVPVSYHSRTHAQGKKLQWRDGVSCVSILLRVRILTARSHHQRRMESRAVTVEALRLADSEQVGLSDHRPAGRLSE
jgi:dolichol-phosphate hexosyltransferase